MSYEEVLYKSTQFFEKKRIILFPVKKFKSDYDVRSSYFKTKTQN